MMIQQLIEEWPALHRCFVEAAVAVLNEALAADRKTINQFFKLESVVNTDEFRDHPTIQVGAREILNADSDDKTLVVRPLSLINGLFGADEKPWGFIAVWTKGGSDSDDWIDYFYVREK